MAKSVVHQSQQRDAEEDTRRELEPGAAAANGQPPDHAAEDTGNDLHDAIALRRLLAVATLTPAQAGLLAVDLMDTLVTLEERGECPDQVNDRSVLVRRDGTVAVVPSPEVTTDRATSAATATTDTAGANGRATGAASASEEDSGGDDSGETAAGGSANGSTSTKARSNGTARSKNGTSTHTRSGSRNGTGKSTASAASASNGTANGTGRGSGRTGKRGVEPLPVAATTANSLVRLLVAHTRGGSARRKVDAALLTDRLSGISAELTELRDKVRGVANELAAGDSVGWDDWTTATRRQITALVTATEGRTALRDRTPSGGAQHEIATNGPAAGTADTTDDAGRDTDSGSAGESAGDSADSSASTDTGTSSAATSSSSLSLARGDLRGARRRAWHRKRRLPRRKAVVIVVIVALVAVAGWWAVPRAWSELRRGWEAVFTTSEPSQQLPPVAPPEDESSGGKSAPGNAAAANDADEKKDTNKPGPVPRLAPEEAGPISGVTIERAEGECARGELCPVRVDVMLDPSAAQREVSWSLRIVDRCTDKIRKREGVTMSADAGWRQVYGISRPTLPDSRALAIVAVTNTPAKAASAPLLVSANRATC